MSSENALLIGLSRQTALARELDVLANNLANLSTTGFKRDAVAFESYLMPVAQADSFQSADRQLAFVLDRGVHHDFSSGGLKLTGNELDAAIQGEGFFVVQTPQGERYTRSGAFARNAQGELATSEGDRVLGDRGPITFAAEDQAVTIAADGTVSTSQGVRGRLRIVRFENPQRLEKAGTGLFASGEAPLPAPEARVAQGALEGSNVQGIAEMARLLEVSRSYQNLSALLQRGDELRRTAIERLGQVQA